MSKQFFQKDIRISEEDVNFFTRENDERVIALAGNPNVGKSTVFNHLTGLKQHTGNWPGKTVSNASGSCCHAGTQFTLVDLPGTYSLISHSKEEEAARDFILFGRPDAVAVVCDAACLSRNLNLVLQSIEITPHVVVCVNLLDEAEKKGIHIDLKKLESLLGVPVTGTSARSGQGLREFMNKISGMVCCPEDNQALQVKYGTTIEGAVALLEPFLAQRLAGRLNARWAALRLLEDDQHLISEMGEFAQWHIEEDEELQELLLQAKRLLQEAGLTGEAFQDQIVISIMRQAEQLTAQVTQQRENGYSLRDRRMDKILTGKWTGLPIMLLLLAGVFWLTISGANYPSKLLSDGLFWVEDQLLALFQSLQAPSWLSGILIKGMYRTLAWVVSVMLPPMAIFFPLFTLLEDAGYLPRISFNLDKYFKKACACGKQALTMCMGFGCNAAGVVGCRIIDSPRERLIAILTNTFVPCNGRFPTLVAIITMFFAAGAAGGWQSLISTLMLTGVIVLGVVMTLLMSKVLSHTVLKGVPSSFTLELPPYRRPQVGRVIVRSVFDRTLFVLGRAAAVAAPAGAVIWIFANIQIGDASLLQHCADFLQPLGHLMGLDGVILMAFILGFPANEIVVPIMIMAYMATGNLAQMDSLTQLKQLLLDNGWTWLTALNTMLFSLMHFPCSTTCLTIRKETGSLKWTMLGIIIPTAAGILICILSAGIAGVFSY